VVKFSFSSFALFSQAERRKGEEQTKKNRNMNSRERRAFGILENLLSENSGWRDLRVPLSVEESDRQRSPRERLPGERRPSSAAQKTEPETHINYEKK
jgi:hypothetical protein